MSEMIEKVAKAIEAADISYSVRLTRLVDDVATYTLSLPDHEPMEFPSHDKALEYVAELRNAARARAAIEAMREPTYVMIETLAVSIRSYPEAYSAYQGMIDAALSAPVVTGRETNASE
jgi:hypothetical protein